MRYLYLTLIALHFCVLTNAQSIYYKDFNSASFPAGWTPSDGRIALSSQVTSNGYTSSPTSPPASGGNNVRFDDCLPTGATVSLTVSGVISTTGWSNIRVGFGLRKSGAWNRPVLLEWSSDGTNWNTIDPDVSAYALPNNDWSSIYFDLPSGADNVANLRFRYSFVTANTQNCTTPPNFRIDDFIVGANASLPVEFTGLSARFSDGRVHLSWSTATETDNSHFVVERGADGRMFAEIGRVNGAGTVREKQEYVFTDEKPLAGANYYRLRQVDFDGQFSFSPVRRVVAGQAAGALTLFPNPAGAILQVQLAEAAETEGSWEIFDTGGKRLAAGVFPAENDIAPVYVGDLPVGIYCLRLINGPNSWQKTFIKQ